MAPAPSPALTSSSVTASSCPPAGHNTNHNHGWNCQFRPTMPLKCTSLALGVTAQQLTSHLGHPNRKTHSVTSELLDTAVRRGSEAAGNATTPLRNTEALLCEQLPQTTVASFFKRSHSSPIAEYLPPSLKGRAPDDSPLTCSIASVVEIDSEGPGLVSRLP